MKNNLFLPLILIFISSCSKPLNYETLIEKNGLMYDPNKWEPYTGEIIYKPSISCI